MMDIKLCTTILVTVLQNTIIEVALPLKMEEIGSPKTSFSNHLMPRNNPEDGRIPFNHDRNLDHTK
jgi:hypothetical protein